jgi:uncharacterized membrane protein
MEPISAPNWLSIVGSCYLIFAFGFLAGSAGFRRGWDATPEVRQQVTDYGQRVLMFAAGMLGVIGMLFQFLGQFVTVEHGIWFVLACLALVPIVLAYVFLGDQKLERYRRLIEGSKLPSDTSTGSVRAKAARVHLAALTPTGGGEARNAAE